MDLLHNDISPWLRMLALQLRFEPERVVFLGFHPRFATLARESHPGLSRAHFLMHRSDIDLYSINATVLENGAGLYCLTTEHPIRDRVPVETTHPEHLLCDLTYLLAVASDDGHWLTPRNPKVPDAYEWSWNRQAAYHESGVYVWQRRRITREEFGGPVMDNTAASNHNYPEGFLTLGTDEVGFESRNYRGGWLRLRFDAGRLAKIRRAFLNVIWPPFHGRGLIGAQRSGNADSGNPMVSLRLWQHGKQNRAQLLAYRQCDILGHYGRFFSQPYTEWQLKIVLDPKKMKVDHNSMVEIDLELTDLACLDVYGLTLHMFGTRSDENGWPY
jgi:hypothetical protein